MPDPIDIIPTGDDFYIVYEDPKKTSYVTAFLIGINRTGSPGTREAFTQYAAGNISTFNNFTDFNTALLAVEQPAMTYNPYTQVDPDTVCNQDYNGNCT